MITQEQRLKVFKYVKELLADKENYENLDNRNLELIDYRYLCLEHGVLTTKNLLKKKKRKFYKRVMRQMVEVKAYMKAYEDRVGVIKALKDNDKKK